nr:MAG TPA: TRASH domain protein [Caudoviricetes sp.]
MTALARDLRRTASAQEAGLAAQERRSFMPPRYAAPAARCPVCGSHLQESDELAYELDGGARGECLGCEHCTNINDLEQAADLLRYTAWEVDDPWQ